MAVKQPFERILSLLDRKKFFSKLVLEKTPVIVKLSSGALISFRGLRVTKEGHLDGLLNQKALSGAKQSVAVVFFYINKDRYFLNTKVVNLASGGWRIMNSTDFYRLNRRDVHRTQVPDGVMISMYVASISGVSSRIQVRITDFSSSGARIRWADSQTLSKGAIIKGNLIWLKGKEFPVVAKVMHRSRDGSYGVEFINKDSVQANRMRILSIELQQFVTYVKG